MGVDHEDGPFVLPDGTGRIGLYLALFTLVAVVVAVVVIVSEFRRGARRSWWRVGVATACAVGIMFVGWAVCQPVTFVRDGLTFNCAYSDPTFDIARMRGVPDDTVLVADQRYCRARARTLLGIEASAAALFVAVLAGTAALSWRARRGGRSRPRLHGGSTCVEAEGTSLS